MEATILRTVKKLLALSRGTNNPNEAAAAMRAATKLIEEHRLNTAELKDESSGDKPIIEKDPIIEAGKIENWKKCLVTGLAKTNACDVLAGNYKNKGFFVQYAILVGRPSDIAIVRELYTYLILELTRLYKADQRTDYLHRGSWWDGAVVAVRLALEAGKKDARRGATSTSIVLVDRRVRDVEDLLKKAIPKLKTRRVKASPVEALSFHKGAAAGKRAMASRGRTRLEPPKNTVEDKHGQLGFDFHGAYNAGRRSP